jgi:8-oxo-dGTP pyrophosphatase MutT (NUDIX family)
VVLGHSGLPGRAQAVAQSSTGYHAPAREDEAVAISEYMRSLRERVGPRLLLVPSVTVLARDRRDRVLLVEVAGAGVWVAPGGMIDPLERPADAAVREMWEETGLVVELDRLLGVYGGPEFQVTYPNGDVSAYVMTVFGARVVGGELRPDGEEICDAAWVAPDDPAGRTLAGWVPIVLGALGRDPDRAHFEPPHWRPPQA